MVHAYVVVHDHVQDHDQANNLPEIRDASGLISVHLLNR